MTQLLNCLINDDFVTIALYIQALENDAIIISRVTIDKNDPIFYIKRFAVRLYN